MTGREKALEYIAKRKKEAEEKHLLFLDSLRKDEAFDDLIREGNSLKWDYVKAKTEEQKKALQDKIDENEGKIASYVVGKGYSKDAVFTSYACKKCNDTGFVNGTECSCVEEVRRLLEIDENPLLRDAPASLKDIDFSYYQGEKEKKMLYASAIEKGLEKGKKYFLLAGKTGTAKTFFACSAVKSLLFQGKDVLAIGAIKLNKLLLEYHCAPLEKKGEIRKKIDETDVLLIDDLGAEQILNNVTVPYLLEILTERTDKVTFVTTNLSLNDLDKRYGQRILSRLLDKNLSIAILFDGKDLRF